MPTLYYKQLEAIHNVWGNATNWFTNPEATVSAGGVPWVSNNAFKTYDLAFATGQTLSPLIGEDASSGVIGQGFEITGVCNMALQFGFNAGEGVGNCSVYGGTWSGAISLFTGTLYGGIYSNTVTGIFNSTISGGVFNGAVACDVSAGTFNNTVLAASIQGGTFNGAVTSTGATIGGTFNGSVTQTGGTISGGTFNGTYTRVAGNVTGGTFNNGIINQFYRNGFPPPFVFTGYNPNALDVLGTGL